VPTSLRKIFSPRNQLDRSFAARGAVAIVSAVLALWLQINCAVAAEAVNETFSGPTLSSPLELSTSGSFAFNGVATNTSNSRQYIRTAATDYNSYDFSLSVTFTVPTNGGGGGMAFIGFGSGTPDTGFYGEPLQSLYFRSAPNNFGSGFLQPSINSSTGTVAELTNIGFPSSGTHRAQLTKVGDTITFSLDANSSGGTFTADYSTSFSQSTNLTFLNNTNSRLFVGSETSGVTFDSFAVTTSAIPEPSTYAALAGLAALGLGVVCRRRST
jgi:hypothetical protein